jgi:hypothetical protein
VPSLIRVHRRLEAIRAKVPSSSNPSRTREHAKSDNMERFAHASTRAAVW